MILEKMPPGKIRVNKTPHSVQYYLRQDSTEKTGKYIPKPMFEKASRQFRKFCKQYPACIFKFPPRSKKFHNTNRRRWWGFYSQLVKHSLWRQGNTGVSADPGDKPKGKSPFKVRAKYCQCTCRTRYSLQIRMSVAIKQWHDHLSGFYRSWR